MNDICLSYPSHVRRILLDYYSIEPHTMAKNCMTSPRPRVDKKYRYPTYRAKLFIWKLSLCGFGTFIPRNKLSSSISRAYIFHKLPWDTLSADAQQKLESLNISKEEYSVVDKYNLIIGYSPNVSILLDLIF